MEPSSVNQYWRYSTLSTRSFDTDSDLSFAGTSFGGQLPGGGFAPSGWGPAAAPSQTPAAAAYARPPPPWVTNDKIHALPAHSGPAAEFRHSRDELASVPQVLGTTPSLPQGGQASGLNSPDIESMGIEELLAVDGRLPLLSADVGNRRVFYVDRRPNSVYVPPADRTILLLHAIPEGPHSLRKLLPLLVARGFRVIAPTLRGFNPGDPKPLQADSAGRNAFYSWRASVAELVGLLQILQLEQVIVAGYSFGSQMASALALLAPSVVSKLVLLSIPYIPPASTYIPPAMLALKADPSMGVRVYLGTDRAVSHFDEMPALFFHVYCRPGGAEEFKRVVDLACRLGNMASDDDTATAVDELMKHPSSLFAPKETLLLVRWLDAIGGSGGILQWHRVEANTVEEFQNVPREIQVPVLYVGAEFQRLSAASHRAEMKRLCSDLTEVILAGAGIWIAVERAKETADLMADWIEHGQVSEMVLSSIDVLDGGFSTLGSRASTSSVGRFSS